MPHCHEGPFGVADYAKDARGKAMTGKRKEYVQ